jgi:hypothetical protein
MSGGATYHSTTADRPGRAPITARKRTCAIASAIVVRSHASDARGMPRTVRGTTDGVKGMIPAVLMTPLRTGPLGDECRHDSTTARAAPLRT